MEQLINFIIRPPRAEYNPKNDLLDQEFMLNGKWYQRKDLERHEPLKQYLRLCNPPAPNKYDGTPLEQRKLLDEVVVNSRGDSLQCSHYTPLISPEGNALPCVIYCHGNSGCRADASEAAVILLPSNITVFSLDFSGSGLSGGEHVTLGWNEKDDLRAVVDYLRADGNVSLIGLWGRSMGAVTSLMYGAEDPSIAGMVLDSPFSDLVDLMMELVDTFKVKFAIQYMRKAIQKKAKFDIMELNTPKVAKSCFVPVLFGHAIDDDFIQPHHSDRIFDVYVGDKNIIKFEGDHNSLRPQFYFDSISIFFNNVLQPPEDGGGSTYFDLSNNFLSKGRCSAVHDVEISTEVSGSSSGSAASSSTEDAIKQLRSKRPMSAMVVPADISSKDNQPCSEVESRGLDSHPSTSNMTSFEFCGGSPRSSNVPGSVDDDEYIEYSLDMLADFPSNVEEEERMLMVAILESLKDSEASHPPLEEVSPGVGVSALHKPEPAPNKEEEDRFFPCSNSVETEPVSNQLLPHSSHKHAPSSDAEARQTGNMAEGERSGPASRSNTPSDDQRLLSDMADRTKVTLEVEKNPSSNVIDALLRRWDFNFFRSR